MEQCWTVRQKPEVYGYIRDTLTDWMEPYTEPIKTLTRCVRDTVCVHPSAPACLMVSLWGFGAECLVRSCPRTGIRNAQLPHV